VDYGYYYQRQLLLVITQWLVGLLEFCFLVCIDRMLPLVAEKGLFSDEPKKAKV